MKNSDIEKKIFFKLKQKKFDSFDTFELKEYMNTNEFYFIFIRS